MATLYREQRGLASITHYRGRIMRIQLPADAPASKERRRICVLSVAAAQALEMWSIAQPCFDGCTHSHHTRELIEQLVAEGSLRWIGTGKNIAAWCNARTWKGTPSGPTREKVMQWV